MHGHRNLKLEICHLAQSNKNTQFVFLSYDFKDKNDCPYSVTLLMFITEAQCVYCEVRADSSCLKFILVFRQLQGCETGHEDTNVLGHQPKAEMFYAYFWAIPRRLNFICRRFGTLCMFHLHRRVSMKNYWRLRMLGYLYGKIFG